MFGAFVVEFWTRRLEGKGQWHDPWIEPGCIVCEGTKKVLANIVTKALKEMGR